MNIDIFRVHNHWREKRGSLDPLRGVVEVREDNTWREKRGGGGGGGGGEGQRKEKKNFSSVQATYESTHVHISDDG